MLRMPVATAFLHFMDAALPYCLMLCSAARKAATTVSQSKSRMVKRSVRRSKPARSRE